MKIVFLAPFGIRPKGTVIARMLPLAVALQALGHKVTIVTPPYTNPEDSGRTEYVRGVRLVNVSLPAGGKAVGALPLAWRMFRAMLAEKPELVHLFKPKGYGGLAAMLHLSLQRLGLRLAPLFVDTDDWEGQGGMNDLHPYSTVEKRLFAFQEQWLSKRSVGVTAASRELERLSSEMAPGRILYLPNGVDDRAPGNGKYIREKFGIPAEAPVVLLYTRFFEFDQERLYRLFTRIHEQAANVRFLVVGKGRDLEEEHLVAAARDRGFDAALVMAGWLDPAEIPDYLAAADVAVYPLDDSLVNRAKCPAKLTELLLAGVPVVADGVGQVKEYIRPGISGIFCDAANWRVMADGVIDLLSDRAKRLSLGAAGRNQLITYFHWQGLAGKLLEFYTDRVGGPLQPSSDGDIP